MRNIRGLVLEDDPRVTPTGAAAQKLGRLFQKLVDRGEERARAQRFTLSRAASLFSARAGRELPGRFAPDDEIAIACCRDELDILADVAREDWSKIDLTIFGTILQASMTRGDRHRRGAHYTREADIQRVVYPTIVLPWRARIADCHTLEELSALREALLHYRVLDPACGSGNFLHVAFRELLEIERSLLARMNAGPSVVPQVSARQLFGIDKDPLAVELTKWTLALASPLPPGDLDQTILLGDALFCPWPEADAIIGNPPFQSKNKAAAELGADYMRKVRARYPHVPGRADYCVFWFRRAHDELPRGGRAGLVGTNTIRQNYSREGGLQYIVDHGGTITEAVSTQVWPGEAVVHVSVVNWIKGEAPGKKALRYQIGDQRGGDFHVEEVEYISPALTAGADVTTAVALASNSGSNACFQGQTHGHEGFLLAPEEAAEMTRRNAASRPVIHSFLIGEDLLASPNAQPSRYIIDLNHCEDIIQASAYEAVFSRLRARVLPDIERAARAERAQLGKTSGPRQSHAQKWWRHWRGRPELIERLSAVTRYIVCSRVTKRPIFDFVSSVIRPNDALSVFLFKDDYSFGILQSSIHWAWFTARCSTLKGDFRYTSNTVFASFPWPQSPTIAEALAVARAAADLRLLRRKLSREHAMSLRSLYTTLEAPGRHPLRDAHDALDNAVRAAYRVKAQDDALSFLIRENRRLAALETGKKPVVGPGLPPCINDPSPFITTDCVVPPDLG